MFLSLALRIQIWTGMHFIALGKVNRTFGYWSMAQTQRPLRRVAMGSEFVRLKIYRCWLGRVVSRSLRCKLTHQAGNVKVDVVTATDNSQSLMVSADTVLVSGIPDAVLLGSDNLTLTGNDDDNRLTGNAGENILIGAGCDDVLSGGGRRADTIGADEANADILQGGAGDDHLIGESGADPWWRSEISAGWRCGRDTFVFADGDDVIADFTNNVDMIELVTDATIAEVMAAGEIIGDISRIQFW